MKAALRTQGLQKSFGGLQALSNLSLEISAGEVFGLIGPNGSGKTTTINLLSGVYRPSGGRVFLGDQELTGRKPEQIARSGLARTFQNLRLFPGHSVLDNVRAAQTANCRSLWARVSAIPTREEQSLKDEAMSLLETFGLADMARGPAAALSYGNKKRLEIARALALRPRVLLLDEPAAGMNPAEIDWLMSAVREIAARGIAIVLVEHHMRLIMNVCDRIAVLNFGALLSQGTPSEIASAPQVVEAYLGRSTQAC